MIKLRGIARTFYLGDQAVHALDGVNLEVTQGDYISVMGPSGSGKSTLLNVIGLLDRPDAGEFYIDDISTAVTVLRKRLLDLQELIVTRQHTFAQKLDLSARII